MFIFIKEIKIYACGPHNKQKKQFLYFFYGILFKIRREGLVIESL